MWIKLIEVFQMIILRGAEKRFFKTLLLSFPITNEMHSHHAAW